MAFNISDSFATKARQTNRHNKRAPKACESCRSRKVRCDVTRTKVPCTNCRLDCKTCTVPISKRRHVGDRILSSNHDLQSGHDYRGPICDAIIDFGDIQSPLSDQTRNRGSDDLLDNPEAFPFDFLEIQESSFMIPSRPYDSGLVGVECDPTSTSPGKSCYINPYPSPSQTIASEGQAKPILPSFISPLGIQLPDEDWDYLKGRGAFEIPEKDVRDELLRSFVKWVHPFMPMLDLEQILLAILFENEDNTNGVSLLLFQAMMFAASAFSSLNLGHGEKKNTRKVLYERARLLHDFSFETDRLCLIQAAILLSLWDGSADSVRDSYYWIGIATLHANTMNLSFDPTMRASDLHKQRVLKRTWWSLLVRDRLLAVALRRPVQNAAFRFDVPMLQVEDFELESLIAIFHTKLGLDDISLTDMETLACAFEGMAQLSEYIDRTLATLYVVQRPSGSLSYAGCTSSLIPRSKGIKLQDITILGGELQNWFEYLPAEVQQRQQQQQQTSDISNMIPAYGFLHVHISLLAAYYSMAVMTLYRPSATIIPKSKEEIDIRNTCSKTVFEAAANITDIFGNLYALSLTNYLPDTAIAALEPAVVSQLLHSMSGVPDVRSGCFQRFFLCWQVLAQFGDLYYIADTTLSMLNVAIRKLKCCSEGKLPKTHQLLASASGLKESVKSATARHIQCISVDEDEIEPSPGPPLFRSFSSDETMPLSQITVSCDNLQKSATPDHFQLAISEDLIDNGSLDQLLSWGEISMCGTDYLPEDSLA